MPFPYTSGKHINRREFIRGFALAMAALPRAFSATREQRLPIAFSTLGCPAWDWLKVLDFAQQNGFAAVELRGLQGTMDLPSRPEFSPERIEQSKKEVAARGLRIACVSSSSNLHDADPEKHNQQLADARRFIDLASTLGTPYVRVFGNKLAGPRDEVIARVAASLRELGSYAGPKHVTVLIESHGDFTNAALLRSVFDQANSPDVALLWDAHNSFVEGKEDPAVSVKELGKYIRHTHLKDAKIEGENEHYVLTGRGDVPVKRQVQLLSDIGYKGYYCFEWEKVWHPDIDDPEIAIADYAKMMSGYLKESR